MHRKGCCRTEIQHSSVGFQGISSVNRVEQTCEVWSSSASYLSLASAALSTVWQLDAINKGLLLDTVFITIVVL